MRRILTIALVVAGCAAASACGGDGEGARDTARDGRDGADVGDGGDGAGDGGVTDVDWPDVDDRAPAPYTVGLEQVSTVGWVGQPIGFRAYVGFGDPGGVIQWLWVIEGGSSSSEPGQVEQSVTFDTPGIHRVRVVANDGEGGVTEAATMVRIYAAGAQLVLGDLDDDKRLNATDADMLQMALLGRAELTITARDRADIDLDGRIGDGDLALLEEAVVRGEGAPRRLSPTSGSRGRVVRIIHPALLNTGARATVRFGGDAAPLVPVRGSAGYATTMVPLVLTAAGLVDVVLEVGGEAVERWRFAVEAPPAVGAHARVPGALALLAEAAPRLGERVEALLSVIDEGAETDEASLRAIATTVAASLVSESERFSEAFAQLGPEARALVEELALANGLVEAQAALEAFAGGAPEAGGEDSRIDALCAAGTGVEALQSVVRSITAATAIVNGLKLLEIDDMPEVDPIIRTMSAAAKELNLAAATVDYLEGFAPSFGDRLRVTAAGPDERRANVLAPGEQATLDAGLPIRLAVGPCVGGGAGFVTNKLRDFVLASHARDIPMASGLFDSPDAPLGAIQQRFVDATHALVASVDDLVGVNALLASTITALCRALSFGDGLDAELALDAASVVTPSCGAVASDGAGGATWTCDASCVGGHVRLSALGPGCAAALAGDATLSCRVCDASTCPDGCCSPALECVAGSTSDACGTGGAACAQCEGYDTCESGACQCVSDCTQALWSEGKRCQDTFVRECVQAEPGCFKEKPAYDCAVAEARCEEGACTGGCGRWNCPAPGEPLPGQGHPCCARDDSGALACQSCQEVPWGASVGDPHLVTFDGLVIDFHAAGEFVLVEPVRGGAGPRIMARLEPYGGAACPDAAITTAVAARVGGSRVSVTATADGADLLRVDGLELDLAPGETWAVGTALLTRTLRGWTIDWEDTSRLEVSARETWLDVRVTLAERWAGAVRGLLGNFDTDRNNDLATRDDAAFLSHPVLWDRLYDWLGASFRIGAAESLFDYDAGQAWGGFDVPDFPSAAARVEALDDDARATAEATCGAIVDLDPALSQACVLDVACTGKAAAADGLSGLGNGDLTPAVVAYAVPLSDWTIEGERESSSWIVTDEGRAVMQGVAGGVSFFVSPDDYFETTVTGTLRVDTSGDDDLIGIAFGYQAPLTAPAAGGALDFDLLLLSWKQKDQTSSVGFSPAGFTLARVAGTVTSPAELDAFWTHDAAAWPGYTTLAQLVAPDLGWALHRDHRFRLDYAADRLRILIDGAIIFDLTPAEAGLERFPSGRFAFYNNAQQGAVYRDLYAAP